MEERRLTGVGPSKTYVVQKVILLTLTIYEVPPIDLRHTSVCGHK